MNETLKDNALVIRGGVVRDVEKMCKVVERAKQGFGLPAISVFAINPIKGENREDLKIRLYRESHLPHKQVQFSTVRKLRLRGFILEHDTSEGQAECHYNIVVTYPPDSVQLEQFIQAFSNPEKILAYNFNK